VKSVFEVLGEQGYECSLFYSSYLDYTGFRDFLNNRHLTKTFDADTMPGAQVAERISWGLSEDSTAQAIRQQLKSYARSGERFFLTYIPAAPHYPYDKIPKEFRQFKLGLLGDYSPLYLNDLLYMDSIIASLVDELKETGLLAKTLVVITSDHGEMLGENGGPMGHGWRVTPQLANVPLIIMDPERKEYQINPTIGSQVDLLPTLLDALGLRTPVGELYQGRSLYSPPIENRRIYLSSYDEFGVISGQEIHTGSRRNEPGNPSDPAGLVQRISNLGSMTVVTETNSVAPFGMKIREFDDFQANLLQNYAYYRDSLRTVPATNLLHTTR
jgi:arylsulfatase A-like enzyme